MYYMADTLEGQLPPTFTDVLDVPPTDDVFASVARVADMELLDVLTDDFDSLAFIEDDQPDLGLDVFATELAAWDADEAELLSDNTGCLASVRAWS